MFYALIQGVAHKPHFYSLSNPDTGEVTRVLDGIGGEVAINPVLDLSREVIDHVVWQFGVGEMMSHVVILEVDYTHHCLIVISGAADDRVKVDLPDYGAIGLLGQARPDRHVGSIMLAADINILCEKFDTTVKRFCQPVKI